MQNHFKRQDINKSEIVVSNFAPSAATWRTQQNIRVVLDSGPLVPLCKKHDVILKTANTYHIALWSKEDRATAINDMYSKFREV